MHRNDLKHDAGKLKHHLILNDFLDGLAEIMTKGEVNHPPVDGQPSWKLVEPEAYLDAMYRHISEFRKDPKALDKDMGTHHMLHVAINAMFLYHLGDGKGRQINPSICKGKTR